MIQDFRHLGFFNSKKANLFQNKFFYQHVFLYNPYSLVM